MKSRLQLPIFEKSPEEITKLVDALIENAKAKTKELGEQSLSSVSFQSTLGVLDQISWEESSTMSRFHVLHNMSPNEKIREAAEAAVVKFQNYSIERAYDAKVFAAVKAYAAKNEKLAGEEKKLCEETLRDYKRLGLDLPLETQEKLKKLQKELSEIETQFSSAINQFEDFVIATREDLDGLDENFIQSLKKTDDSKFKISLQYPEYLPTMEFAKNGELRKQLLVKKYNVARDVNSGRLTDMVKLRKQISEMLGYASWNHYVIEERMAKSPAKVFEFMDSLEKKLQPKVKAELAALTKLKAEETKNPSAQFETWDYSFYSSLYKKKFYEVDTRSLRDFFPLEVVLGGFFKLIETLFDLKFAEQKKNSFDSWHEDVRLFKVLSGVGEELGAFFLDLFPRPGKYGHAAAFGLSDGKLLADGTYSRPVKAMVCNFTSEAPHLLSHSEVETLFHEFGHILHGLLTWAKFNKFAGTHVAWDFVEAPSQVLENWAWDYEILQMISKHYKDPSAKISKDLVDKMEKAQKAGSGLFYLRQVSFAKADLAVHGTELVKDPVAKINEVIGKTYLPVPEGTTLGAGFGHLVGYASGYYGYAWADVMAADIFSLFQSQGLLNKSLGIRLKKEIYETGSSRDENLSLEGFLQRPLSSDAFFESIGVA